MLEQQTYKVTAGIAGPGRENDLKLIIALHDDDDNHSIFYNKGKPIISKGDPCGIKGSAYTTGQTLLIQKRANEITTVDVSGYGNVTVEIYGNRENLHRNMLSNDMPELNLNIAGGHAVSVNNVANFNVNLDVSGRTDVSLKSDITNMSDINTQSDLSVAEGLLQVKKNLIVGNTSGTFTKVVKHGSEPSALRIYESETPQNVAVQGSVDVQTEPKPRCEGGIDVFHIDGDTIESYATENSSLALLTPAFAEDLQTVLSSLKGKHKDEAKERFFEAYAVLCNKKAYPGFNAVVARKQLFATLDEVSEIYDKTHKARTNTNIKSPVDAIKDGCETLLRKLTLEDKAGSLDAHILESPSAAMPAKQDLLSNTIANFTANVMSVIHMAQNAVRPSTR